MRLPLVYNTGGYDSLEALRLLDGIIDIYLPDRSMAIQRLRFSGVKNYTEVNQAAVLEMHRQVGDLVVDSEGVAIRGLLVRHLVLPGDAAGSSAVLDFIAQKISPQTYLNLMDHYYPWYRADSFPPIGRSLRHGESGIREMWLEVSVLKGSQTLATEKRPFILELFDREGKPAMPWEAVRFGKDTRIGPKKTRVEQFNFKLAGRADVRVEAKLLERLVSEQAARYAGVPPAPAMPMAEAASAAP